MKKIIAICTLISTFALFLSPCFALDSTKKTKFIVTAYYSPLPNQSYYMRWSYGADVVLNGEGKHGASGKNVYPGMLAAPKTYAFGTKIRLHGLGVGVVDDRWGAIVPTGLRNNAYDRIDVWMGFGDEGLRRALQWGRRTIDGEVLGADEDASLEIENLPLAPKSSIEALKIEDAQQTGDDVLNFQSPLSEGSSEDDIRQAQIVFKNLGYFQGEPDGKYGKKLIDAIYDFQREKGVVQSEFDFAAGFLGKKTRQALTQTYNVYLEKEKQVRVAQEKARKEAEKQEKILLAKKEEVRKNIEAIWLLKPGAVGQNVRALQKTLKAVGYFDGDDTAIFGEKTRESLIKYQLDHGITEESSVSGFFGKKTQDALVEDIIQKMKKDS